MTLTFLNLIAVSGILVGLIAGSERAVQEQSIGDIVITALDSEEEILQTETFKRTLGTIPEIADFSVRYQNSGQITANYKTRRDLEADSNTVGAGILGIDPDAEDRVTNLSENVVEGRYFTPGESGKIILGALNLERFTAGFADITGSLEGTFPGDMVRVTINGNTQEFEVIGIVDAKAGDVASRAYLPTQELRRLSGSASRNADTIVIRLDRFTSEYALGVKQSLVNQGLEDFAKIRTFDEALPKFLTDIKQTFNILGTLIGAIGLVVASITIFIIIFINAISRRQQIGILKGIGIERRAIEIAYVLQAGFYGLLGSFFGALITYGFLIGYFDRNPIDFPFSDGIMVAPVEETLVRFVILLAVTLIAGLLPAWIIVKQNTLNSILGRK
jgi:ABC-type lipoprotein release transport system permease subunit